MSKYSFKNLFKSIDLTKGTPWKVILVFWVPIVLSYLFQQSYTLIDELICGHYLADSYVTGIDDTNSLVFLILQFAFGCTAGFSVISGGKKGENDIDGLRKSFVTQTFLALIVSIILTIIAVLLVPFLLNALSLNETNNYETYHAAKIFITTIYAGLFTQIFYNLICSFLRSIGDSLTPFLFLAGSTFLSIGLDFLFIAAMPQYLPDFGLKGANGVFGAALSVDISQFLAAFACYIYAIKKYPYLKPKKEDFKFSWNFCYEHLKLGLPMAFQFSILAIGLIVLQNNVVSFDNFSKNYYLTYNKPFHYFGVDFSPIYDSTSQLSFNLAQTSFGPSSKFEVFLEVTLDALGASMLSFCSQNRGARNYKRIKIGIKQSFIISSIICTIIALIELLASINGGVLYLFLHKDYVTDAVKVYTNMWFYCIAPATYILGILFIVRSSIQGLGKSFFPLCSGILELVARVLVCLFLPAIINPNFILNSPHYGWAYLSVCLAHPFAWILAIIPPSIALYFYVFKNKLEIDDFKKYGDGKIL